jgi:hypothetical protein
VKVASVTGSPLDELLAAVDVEGRAATAVFVMTYTASAGRTARAARVPVAGFGIGSGLATAREAP